MTAKLAKSESRDFGQACAEWAYEGDVVLEGEVSFEGQCEICKQNGLKTRVPGAIVGVVVPLDETEPEENRDFLKALAELADAANNFSSSINKVMRTWPVYNGIPEDIKDVMVQVRVGNRFVIPRENFAGSFHKKTGIGVIIPEGMSKVGTLDAADAVVACVTIGHDLLRSDIDDDWSAAPPWVSTEEWDLRLWEGMIVRV